MFYLKRHYCIFESKEIFWKVYNYSELFCVLAGLDFNTLNKMRYSYYILLSNINNILYFHIVIKKIKATCFRISWILVKIKPCRHLACILSLRIFICKMVIICISWIMIKFENICKVQSILLDILFSSCSLLCAFMYIILFDPINCLEGVTVS